MLHYSMIPNHQQRLLLTYMLYVTNLGEIKEGLNSIPELAWR